MSTYNTTVLGDTPALYATLDDTSGTACVDSSTTAHNGVYTGSPTLSVSPLITTGTSVTFNGSTQYVEFSSVATYAFSGSLTCEAWIKTSTGGTISILNADDTGGARIFQFRLNAGKLELITFSGGSGTTKTGSATVNDGVRHHVVGVYDRSGATIKLYVDGVQDGSTLTSVAAMDTSQTPIQIAERLSSGTHSNLFNGTIDEAAVYKSALSSGQVSTHFSDGGGGTTYTKTGFGDSDLNGFGVSASIEVDTGKALIGTVGSGASVRAARIYTKTGFANVATVGGGPSEIAYDQDVPGRVLIAFDALPLDAHPKWTRIDGGDAPFPDQFVSGYDITSGRQTLFSQTDTGTATVYINDHETALFDPRNVSSPFHGKLDGRQIRLQLYDPVALAWEDQFRGWIDDVVWTIDPSTDNDGVPINASIQVDCVDIFDVLANYGLTPGLDGVTPRVIPSGHGGGPVPAGFEDGVYYATTSGTNDDRMIEILADVGIPIDMYGNNPSFASGNTHVLAVKYDPDESALQALRDAADADLPFIANIFCDRHGRFQFHGRYARFDPDGVSSEPGSTWDFTRWAVGDGAAIAADPTRAQMRILDFSHNRSDIVNVAICYPQDLVAADMPNQVYADTGSILAYGKHSSPPMSDLLLDKDQVQPVSGYTGKVECFSYAKLLVLNQKDPRESITALQLKAVRPDDPRAAKTWALITKADISHIVNVAVGYPGGGTGFTGASPDDDYYIEGRKLMVRPLNPVHDYVELELSVSPAVWSMDLNGVFPPFPGDAAARGLTAAFTVEF